MALILILRGVGFILNQNLHAIFNLKLDQKNIFNSFIRIYYVLSLQFQLVIFQKPYIYFLKCQDLDHQNKLKKRFN